MSAGKLIAQKSRETLLKKRRGYVALQGKARGGGRIQDKSKWRASKRGTGNMRKGGQKRKDANFGLVERAIPFKDPGSRL